MGNSCSIRGKGLNKGVYLHWNGGRDSVEAFLKYCELKGFRCFNSPDGYGIARFCQVVGNYFGDDGLSIGVVSSYGGDNGIYIVDGWEIVGREDFKGEEQYVYSIHDMLIEIDKSQPTSYQLGDFLTAREISREDVKVGDYVYGKDIDSRYKPFEVIGIGEERIVNGTNVKGMPIINKFGCNEDNINNYVRSEIVRIKDK